MSENQRTNFNGFFFSNLTPRRRVSSRLHRVNKNNINWLLFLIKFIFKSFSYCGRLKPKIEGDRSGCRVRPAFYFIRFRFRLDRDRAISTAVVSCNFILARVNSRKTYFLSRWSWDAVSFVPSHYDPVWLFTEQKHYRILLFVSMRFRVLELCSPESAYNQGTLCCMFL